MTRGATAKQLFEALRLRIVSGEYGPGRHLTETQLAEEFGVSRTPVRLALRQLGERELVKVVPNRGARVAEFSYSDIDEIFSLRQLLESRAARLAAERRVPADLTRLRRVLADMSAAAHGKDADRIEQLHRHNELFHGEILAAARSPRLQELTTRLAVSSTTSGSYFAYDDEDIERSCRAHQDILEAIEVRSGDRVAALMWLHLDSARRLFLAARFGRGEVTANNMPAVPQDSEHHVTGATDAR